MALGVRARRLILVLVVAGGIVVSARAPAGAPWPPADRDAVQRLEEEVSIAAVLERLAAAPFPSVSVVRNVRVVDPVAATATAGQSVIVSDGRIAWVGDTAQEPHVDEMRVIDGGGRFLSPGLTDMHVHSESASAWLLDLATGVTTVREMDGFPWLLDVRQNVGDGLMLGPTLYVAGTILNANPLDGYALVPTGPLDARRMVRQEAGCGYSFIKVHNIVPKPMFDAIAEEAARQGMDLVGHVPHHMTVRYAVDHGMRTLEHLKGFIDDRTLLMGDTDYVAVANPNVWVTPTLYCGRAFDEPAALRAMLASPEMKYVPARRRRQWRASLEAPRDDRFVVHQRGEGYRREIVQRLARVRGVQFLAGTDAAGYDFTVMGYGLIEELQLLQRNGLPAPVVLRAATAWPAEAMRTAGEFGQIARGQRADLVLLDANPLESPAAFRSNAGVMVRGRWLTRAVLDSGLTELADIYERPASPIGANAAAALARSVRTHMERGFVFSAPILTEAAAALRRGGLVPAADAIRKAADAPTSGPCAIPAR